MKPNIYKRLLPPNLEENTAGALETLLELVGCTASALTPVDEPRPTARSLDPALS